MCYLLWQSLIPNFLNFRSIAQNPVRLQFVHAPESADLLEVLPMILRFQDVGIHILGEALDGFGVVDVELQVIGIVVIALKYGGRMGSIRLVDDGFDTVCGNDGLFGMPLNVFGGNNFLCNHDYAAGCLRLFLVLPAGTMNLRVSLAVGNLDMNK